MTDETIRLLRRIQDTSWSLTSRAQWILTDVGNLVNRPAWTTKAEDELEVAEKQLTRTLYTIQQARALYARKPSIAAE